MYHAASSWALGLSLPLPRKDLVAAAGVNVALLVLSASLLRR